MSYSVSNLFSDLGLGNVQQSKEDQLFNPDIPQPKVDFTKLKTLKDKSYSALKMPVRSKNSYGNSYLRLAKNLIFFYK